MLRLPGEEGGVVKTVKGEATVRIEGVAFVYGQPGLGNGDLFVFLVLREGGRGKASTHLGLSIIS